MIQTVLSIEIRKVLRLRVEDLARLMMVCPRTVNNWDRDCRPTKLHERIMETFVAQGRRDPHLFEWVGVELEQSAPLEIVSTVLARARKTRAPDPEDVALLRRGLAGSPALLAALERLLLATS